VRLSQASQAALALILGLGGGVLIAQSPPDVAASLGRGVRAIEPLGTLWVNAIRMTVIPLIVSLLVVGVASSHDTARIGRLGVKAFAMFIGMLVVVAAGTALIAPTLFEGLTFSASATDELRRSAGVTLPPAEELTFRTWLLTLIPINAIKAAADGAILPVVIFTLLFAFAATRATTETRAVVVRAFQGIAEVMLIIVRWVLVLAPIGVFALALVLGTRLGASALSAIGFYIGLVIALHLLLTPLLYGLAVVGGGVPLARFARAVLPAQVVAFSTRSSLASLPALVEGARNVLRLPTEATGFVLPLAVSVFKLTSAIYWILGALFIGQLYGVDLGPTQIATIAAASVILNASTPGIPSGGLLIQAPLYDAVGLPVAGLGILIAIDTIPDMFKTAFNVTADMTVATLLGKEQPATAPLIVPAAVLDADPGRT
jgi:proton glutamate symport protein